MNRFETPIDIAYLRDEYVTIRQKELYEGVRLLREKYDEECAKIDAKMKHYNPMNMGSETVQLEPETPLYRIAYMRYVTWAINEYKREVTKLKDKFNFMIDEFDAMCRVYESSIDD